MTKKAQVIKEYLDEILPDARCALNYTKDYELVIAVMLSAQTTDVAVNKVTKNLFSKYNTLESLANASLFDIENEIKTLGMYKNKAVHIIKISQDLQRFYNGKVPNKKEELVKLSGVGNKTANVVLAELFNEPQIAVDTHILRISYRLKITDTKDDPKITEEKLRKMFDRKDYIKLHHQLIWFGRTQCKARNPECQNCKISRFCRDFAKK